MLEQPGGRRATWIAWLGLALLPLFVVGCPEPGELEHPEWWAPPAAGGSGAVGGSAPTAGTGMAGSGMAGTATGVAACEVACVNALFQPDTSSCGACHSTSLKLGKLDLQAAGYAARLKDQAATFDTVTDMSGCPTGAKLIDSAAPANSWFLKKILKQQGSCGTSMPVGPDLSADEKTCLETFAACVAGAQ